MVDYSDLENARQQNLSIQQQIRRRQAQLRSQNTLRGSSGSEGVQRRIQISRQLSEANQEIEQNKSNINDIESQLREQEASSGRINRLNQALRDFLKNKQGASSSPYQSLSKQEKKIINDVGGKIQDQIFKDTVRSLASDAIDRIQNENFISLNSIAKANIEKNIEQQVKSGKTSIEVKFNPISNLRVGGPPMSIAFSKDQLDTIKENIRDQNFNRISNLDNFKKAPFQTISNLIPKTIGQTVSKSAEIVGLGKTNVTIPSQEIYQRSSVSSIPNIGTPRKPVYSQPVSQALGGTVESAVAIGQYAIPYVGETLFLGSLAEKPILQPQEFKKEFSQNPLKMSVAYSLGLVTIAGGIGRALNYAERKLLQDEIKNAKIGFIAEADQDTLRVLATTRIQGKPILTATEIKTLLRSGEKELAAGTAGQIRKLNDKEVEILKQKIVTVSDRLGEARAIRENQTPFLKLSEKVEGGETFRARGRTQNESRRIFQNRGGRPIGSIERVPGKILKTDILGVVYPSEAENIFKVLAGDTRVKIYRQGGVNYVFDPRIGGYLRITPTLSDSYAGTTILKQKLKKAIPLSSLASQVAKSSIESAVRREVAPAFAKLKSKSVLLKSISKSSNVLGGGLSVKQKQKQRSTSTVTSKPFQNTKESPIYKSSVVQSSLQRSAQNTRLQSRQQQQQRQRENIKLAQVSISALKQEQSGLQKLGLRTSQALRQRENFRQPTKTRFPTPIPTPRIPKAGIKPYNEKFSKSKKTSKPLSKFKTYDAFVKRKGKEVRVTRTPTTEKAARGIGLKVADTTLAASVIVRESKRPGFALNRAAEREGQRILSKFRPSKRNANVLVEKSRFRLEKRGRTPEVREIKSYREFGRRR